MSTILDKVRTYIAQDLGVKFRDREIEIAKIVSELVPGYINVVFGPRGCGKTELARALVYASDHDVHVVYVGFKGSETTVKSEVILPDRRALDFMLREVRELIEEVCTQVVPLRLIVRGIMSLHKLFKYFQERREHRQYILLVDKFRSTSQSLDIVQQELEVGANIVRHENVILRELSSGNSCLKVVYLSSDATAQKLQPKVGHKCRWWLMWYLPRREFLAILEELKCPHNPELMWTLLGGNLREVKYLRDIDWNLHVWLNDMCNVITQILRDYSRQEGIDNISRVIVDVEKIISSIDESPMYRLWDYLLNNNVVMCIDSRFLKLSDIPREPWIGEEQAFQIPVYYWILRCIVEKRTVKIRAEDVLNCVERDM